jgi:hypothetical protein
MTAIEWLYNKMYEHKGIITIEEFEQAKEMEKQQIMNAFDEGHVATWNEEAEQYYNETFKSE